MRTVLLLPPAEGLAAYLGLVPLGEAPAFVRPRRSLVVQPQDVPLAGLLGIVPAPPAQAFAMRQTLRLPATDAGPPPALFLFAPWIADDFPPRTTRITRARPPPDGQALSSLTATTLGVLIESLPARPSECARGPVVPPDGQPPLAPFVVSLGAWLDPGAPAPRAMARPSVPRLIFDAPLLGPWGWAPSDASPFVRARRIVQPPVSNQPLAGLIAGWFDGLAATPPFTPRRVPALPQRDAQPLAAAAAALLQWFDPGAPSLALPPRALRLVVPWTDLVSPLIVVVLPPYIPAREINRTKLKARPRHAKLNARSRSAVLLSRNRRSSTR